jgi:hypothetical protein
MNRNITRAAMAIVAVLVATSITRAQERNGNISAISIDATRSIPIVALINKGDRAIETISIATVEGPVVSSIGTAYRDSVTEKIISPYTESQRIANAKIDNHIGRVIIKAYEVISSSNRAVSLTAIGGVVVSDAIDG